MDARKLAETLGNLQARYTQAYVEGWENYWKLVSEMSRNQGSIPEAQKRYYEYVTKQAPAAVGKLMETSVEYYAAVLDAGTQITREFYGAMSKDRPKPADTAASQQQTQQQQSDPQRPRPASELVFEGHAGERPVRQFVVANKTGSALNVAFELSEFVSDTGERVREPADINPSTFTLEPGEEKILECHVPIATSFKQGTEYRSVLRATGLPEMQVILCVRSHGEATETIVAEEPKRSRRKKH